MRPPRPIAADPDHARAHYNLADTLDEMGLANEALEHWRAYLDHDRDSEWAGYARQRIASA